MEDLHKIWPHRWVTKKVKAFNSPIDRLGTIAVEAVSKGELVAILGGIVVPTSDIYKYREKIGSDVGVQIGDNFFICPTNREELKITGVFNHSCEPNTGSGGSIELIAIKDIMPGEELTFDYAFHETNFKPFKCKCGSANCRKIITPDDWKNPELQKKYGQYFAPYLRRKFMKIE